MKPQISKMLQLSSPKVIAMYEGVYELMKEGRDPYTLKVSDITQKAGIGKGTAYEYFETKEELIGKAVFYQLATGFLRMMGKVKETQGFREKLNRLLDDLEENREQRCLLTRCFCYYTQGLFGGPDFIRRIQECSHGNEELKRFIEDLLEAASRDGINIEGVPLHFAVNAVVTQALGYLMYLENLAGAKEIERDRMRDFVYENICRILEEGRA